MRWELIVDPAISGQLCLTLLHSMWLVTLLAAFAWIVDRLVGRRAVERSYAIHVVALLASMMALPATYWVVAAQGVAPPVEVAVVAEAAPTATPAPLAAESPDEMPPETTPPVSDHAVETPPAANVAVLPQPADVAAAPSPPGPGLWPTIAPWLAGLYAAGVVAMLFRLALGMWRAQRLGAGAEVLRGGPLVDMLRSLAGQWSMRVVPTLARAERIVTPKVIGLLCPTILLPASAISGLSTDELELILAHELAHVRRFDMWINLLQRLAETVLFFNPALWYLSRRVSLLREYCCDEVACSGGAELGCEPHVRYAQALLRVVEVAGVGRDRSELTSLAASGRSPSELRRRVARLFGEPIAESVRLSRSGMLLTAALALLLVAGPVVWQSVAETKPPSETSAGLSVADAEDAADESGEPDTASTQMARPDMSIVVARHALLLEGKEIITWPELEDRLKALPDPTLASPSFYVTRGTREAGDDQFAKDQIWRLHKDLKLAGHSEGSLWPRTDLRYDRIKTAEDLVPDESLRVDGMVVDQKGEPVEGAEVILITPVDESISYKSYHMALVQGRVRNRLEHVITDSDTQGSFAVYPPKDTGYYVAALHRDAGFALIEGGQFTEQGKVILLPWAGLVSEVDNEKDGEQEASIRTVVKETEGLPEVFLNQSWSDLKNEQPTNVFHFTHVPAILNTTISRNFAGKNGSSFGIPGATVSLMPGETRRLGLGTMSEQQRALLEMMRGDSEKRTEAAKQGAKEATDAAQTEETSKEAAAEDKSGDTAEAKAPRSTIDLARGLSVTGKVTDESGVPVVEALVRTQFGGDVQEAETNEAGVYTLSRCEPQIARIVATAEGRATDVKALRIEPGMEPVDFQMQPGGKVRVRVLDENDKPIPKAHIQLSWWRGKYLSFEFEHLDPYTDENGIWQWNDAPRDEILVNIRRPGGMLLMQQHLTARADEYVFHVPKALVISGKVVDAETKEPIKEFQAIPGRVSSSSRIFWDRGDGDQSTDGKYRLSLTYADAAHLVRIEASGYQAVVSRRIKNDEGDVTLNFELTKGQDIEVMVLTPDGELAAGAEACLGVAGSRITVKNGAISDYQTFCSRQVANGVGTFRFPGPGTDFELVVAHPTGYAHVKATPESIPTTIGLTAWTRVEGTFRIGQQVAGNVPLQIDVFDHSSRGEGVPDVSFYHEATTAPDGSFVFERVAPGKGRIGRNLYLMAGEGASERMASCKMPIELPVGDTVRLELGGTGRAVIGKLEPPDGFAERVSWNFALIKLAVDLPRPEAPASLAEAPSDPEARKAWWAEWIETEEGKARQDANARYDELRRSKPVFTATVGSDGTFHIDDMPPDEYTLLVRFSQQSPGYLRNYRFKVPETADGTPAEPLDLGVLKLEPEP